MTPTRRGFLQAGAAALGAVAVASHPAETKATHGVLRQDQPLIRRPVIDITDLYHPHQDRGDNFDLIAAYGLPEVDLRAVVLDVTGRYLRPYINPDDPTHNDPKGPRSPGFIPVQQLNYIFDRTVPCAAAPFDPMKSPEDAMSDAPAYQQAGIRLLLQTLDESKEQVDIVSFGSARPLAVAVNREPELLRNKVRMIHLCAGTMPAGYLEWNVYLDVHAFVRVLRADLPLAVYPCATPDGPFALGTQNTYWSMPDLNFVTAMAAPLQRYIEYAFTGSNRMDLLGVLDEMAPIGDMTPHYNRVHHVWETAVWAQVANRKLAKSGGGAFRLVPASEVHETGEVIEEDLSPTPFEVSDDGQITLTSSSGAATKAIYYRADPAAYQRAAREALPALYKSFLPAD